MQTIPRFPDAEVRLSGTDGNAFAIIGHVKKGLAKAGATTGEMTAFVEEATTGDYDNVLATCARWVNVS